MSCTRFSARHASVALATFTFAVFTSAARAQSPSYTVNTFTTVGGGAYALGYTFRPTQDIAVTSLGQWILNGDTINDTETMGIYDSTGALLFSTDYTQANATILGNADANGNQFRYTDITTQFSANQRKLLANTEYTLAGTDYNDIVIADADTLTADPRIHIISVGLYAFGEFQQPTITNIYNMYGMNFQFTPLGTTSTPEPGGFALLIGMSLTGAGFLLRRKLHVTQ